MISWYNHVMMVQIRSRRLSGIRLLSGSNPETNAAITEPKICAQANRELAYPALSLNGSKALIK